MDPVSFAARAFTSSASIGLFALACAALFGACSSSNGAAACEIAACAAGNTCIRVGGSGGVAQCERSCATHTDCPYNYHCDVNTGGSGPYCVVNTVTFPNTSTTQFGAPCNPADGFQDNPACDGALGFYCNASSPLDANAYCTYFGCKADTDCGGGFYCGKENTYPNAASSQLQNGQTTPVCLPRDYCAPCATDVDCAPTNGAPQHCVPGTDGATFCVPECTSQSECALDATCAPLTNYSACMPRAGLCKGGGGLCSPCRSDADCTNGYCVPAFNSTERFCTVPSGVTCSYSSTFQIIDQCPSSTTATPVVGCSVLSVEPNFPPNQCIGQVQEGTNDDGSAAYVEGCWTVH